MRERLSLDGRWRFRHQSDPEAWRRIEVPSVWQAAFPDLRLEGGSAQFERDFELPGHWPERETWLCFGAVAWSCSVLVNGEPVGDHDGGWLPFAFEIGDAVRPGRKNTLCVEVLHPDGDRFLETPHGKQSWYGPFAGIWQTVYLERRPPAHVLGARVRADLHDGVASIDVRTSAPGRVTATVRSPAGASTWTATGDSTEAIAIPVGRAEPWHPETPHLYDLEVQIGDDVWRDEFGFRTVEARDGAVFLNGAPIYLLGALDQDYYLDTITTPPSDDTLREQLLRARELGLNLLRCHIKVPDPRYLRWADRLGVLLWCELPSWTRLTDAGGRELRETLAGMVERDANHPSLIAWTIANESWGLELEDPSHRAWLLETFAWAKELDPTRLWVDNSPCAPNFHLRSDLNDFHVYRAIPDQADDWSRWTAGWVAEPGRTYSPHGDAEFTGDEPMILSEFGNWGLPNPDELRDADGQEPWWFETGDEWGGGVVRPEGVRERFDEWRLNEVFGSWRSFVRESQEHQYESLAYEIRDLRTHSEIAGYVITELTDVHWESNGLLDMARNPKAFHRRFSQVNGQEVVVPRFDRLRCHEGEPVTFDVLAVSGRGRDLRSCRAELSVDGRPFREGPPGAFELEFPRVGKCRRSTLAFDLLDEHGRLVASDQVSMLVTPPPRPIAASDVRIADRWDDEVEAHVEGGKAAVVFANQDSALPPTFGLSTTKRAGTRFAGDWAQGMGWLHPAVSDGLAVGPRVDLAFAGLTPPHVFEGPGAASGAQVLGGLYLGWLREIAPTILLVPHGEGAAIVCAFPFGEHAADDGLACLLVERLVELARRAVS
jgi:hypothetical protein